MRSLGNLVSCAGILLCIFGLNIGEIIADGPVVTRIHRPVHPLLVRNSVCPMLRIEIEVAPGASVELRNIAFALKGSDIEGDLAELGLYRTGAEQTFSDREIATAARSVSERPTFPLNDQLHSGRHVYWLTCRLQDRADLLHRVAAVCTSIDTDTGPLEPLDDPATQWQRIGFALRRTGDDGVHTYRIPALTRSATGSLLAVYDMRRRAGRDLQEDIDIGLSRSRDGGSTWEAPRVIMDMGTWGGLPPEQNGCSDPGIIVDPQTGEIFCFAVWMHGKPGKHQWVDDGSEPGFEIGKAAQLMMVRSRDDGLTWSAPENLTKRLKQADWWLLAPAPQSGFAMPDGTLVMPMQGRTGRDSLATFATIMVSRDHGSSWQLGAPACTGGNECQAARLSDGKIMLNIRNDRERFRAVAVTEDFGRTWREHATSRTTLIEPNCNGSLIGCPFEQDGRTVPLLLFANPHSQKSRIQQTIQVSFDDGATWPDSYHWLLDEGRGAGYPSLTQIDGKHIGIVYEGSQAHLVFEKIPLKELIDPVRRIANEEIWLRMVSREGLEFLNQRSQTPPFGDTFFDLPALRAGMGARLEPTVRGVKTEKVQLDSSLPGEWVVAPGADPDVRLLYLHGGGWVTGAGCNYLPLAADISQAAGCAVLLVDYRLAPEHPFPAGLEDCVTAHRWMIEHGIDGPKRARATFVAGDSAGGNLTLATLLSLKAQRSTMPAAAIAISPATDFTLSSWSLRSVYDPIISAKTMPEFRQRYLVDTDPKHPLASPLFGDYQGLPPLLIQTGEHEMLRDDSLRVAVQARRNGVPVQVEIWPGMVHVFQIRGLPESAEAIKRIGEFIRSNLDSPG